MSEGRSESRKRRSGRVKQRQDRFLEHLALSGNVSESARVAEMQRGSLYRWKEEDAAFSERWDYALEDAADALEAEARRRAVAGYDEPITYGGKVICDPETGVPLLRKRYSDGLMAFLLRAHRPSRFRDGEREARGGISINIIRDDSQL